jgi:hypothetical protein
MPSCDELEPGTLRKALTANILQPYADRTRPEQAQVNKYRVAGYAKSRLLGQVRHHDGATVAEWPGIRMLSPHLPKENAQF